VSVVKWNFNFDIAWEQGVQKVVWIDYEMGYLGEFDGGRAPGDRLSHISGIPYTRGYRDGPMETALYNNSQSVLVLHVLHEAVEAKTRVEATKNVYIFANTECLEGFRQTETVVASCLLNSGTLSDLSLFTLNYDQNEAKKAKEVFENCTTLSHLFLVADTDNHCIRLIVPSEGLTATLAGECGSPGFLDGMRLTSRFRRPKSLGMDRLGVVYVHDEGNGSIRQVQLPTNFTSLEQFLGDVKIVTLLNGTCVGLPRNYV